MYKFFYSPVKSHNVFQVSEMLTKSFENKQIHQNRIFMLNYVI